MRLILFTLLLFPLMVSANISTKTTVSSDSTIISLANDTDFAVIQGDISRLRLENANLEAENKKLEAEIKKLKRGKNLLLGTTIAGAVGTGVGTAFWIKNRKGKKAAQATLDMLTAIEAYQKAHPQKFAAIKECNDLSNSSSEADLKKCYDKLPKK